MGDLVESLFENRAVTDVSLAWWGSWAKACSDQAPKGLHIAETKAPLPNDDTNDPSPQGSPGTAFRRAPTRQRRAVPGATQQQGGGTGGTSSDSSPANQPTVERVHHVLWPLDSAFTQLVVQEIKGNGSQPKDVTGTKHRKLRDPKPGEGQDFQRNGKTSERESSRPQLDVWMFNQEEVEAHGARIFARWIKKERGLVLRDLRKGKNLGTDLVDQHGAAYELKVHRGEMPNEVELQDSQLERAMRDGDRFTLVVIAGMEAGQEPRIKLFPKPLDTLKWHVDSARLKLRGILTADGVPAAR